MKNRLDEIKRMQKLAGLSSDTTKLFLESITVEDVLSEAEVDDKLKTAAQDAMAKGKEELNKLVNSMLINKKDSLKNVKSKEFEKLNVNPTSGDTSAAGDEQPKNAGAEQPKKEGVIKEEGVSIALIISILLATPTLIMMVAKVARVIKNGARSITDKLGFTKKKTDEERLKDNQKIINNIYKFGKAWEKVYLKIIIAGVKASGYGEDYWMKEEVKNGKTVKVLDKQRLVAVAKHIYALVLAVAAMFSVYGGFTSAIQGHIAVAAAETGVVAIKGADLKHLHHQVKGQLGGELDASPAPVSKAPEYPGAGVGGLA